MNNYFIITFMVIKVLCLSSCASYISGQLIDAKGGVIAHPEARVNIIKIDASTQYNKFVKTLTVDNNGKFCSPKNLSKGEYLVEALVPGYKIVSQKVVVNNSLQITLVLEPFETLNLTPTFDVENKKEFNKGSGDVNLMPPQL